MNLNYTSICHYCGEIYTCNKSTSKYCSPRHNSLFHQNGAQIDYTIKDPDGVRRNLNDSLSQLFRGPQSNDGWGPGHDIWSVYPGHLYFGPVPFGEEILLVSGFLIKRIEEAPEFMPSFFFKPFQLLTKEEKAAFHIEKGSFESLATLTFYDEMRKLFGLQRQEN